MALRKVSFFSKIIITFGLFLTTTCIIFHLWNTQYVQSRNSNIENDVVSKALHEKVRKINETLLKFQNDELSLTSKFNSLTDGIKHRSHLRNKVRPEVIIIQPEKEIARKQSYDKQSPVAWIILEDEEDDANHLRHVRRVLERVGYTVIISTWLTEWDLAWGWIYPFFGQLDTHFYDLKPHQRVNHFPGIRFVIKSHLAKLDKPYIPKAFTIPDEKEAFLQHISKHPETLWVKKGSKHKGVKIIKTSEMNFTDDDSFLQRYIDNPLLIDGRRFDIGLYTVMTSIDPLRIYISDEALFRFCPKDYYPFDPQNRDKYVIKDNYTPVWKMPSLKTLYSSLRYRSTETINTYFRSKGIDVQNVWRKLHESVVDIMLDEEETIITQSSAYGSSRNFFELYRIDFIMDDQLNIFLMEVNMSPNLSPTSHPQNKPIYETVIYNTLKLTGVARNVQDPKSDSDTRDMMVSDKDLVVFPEWCTTKTCQHDCHKEMCWTCFVCLSLESLHALKKAFEEHVNRGIFSRVFPPPMNQTFAMEWKPSTASNFYKQLNYNNKIEYMWFVGKCRQHQKWCV